MTDKEIRLMIKNGLEAKAFHALVVEGIRGRYTLDDELAIQRQRDENALEFSEYNGYCEGCKVAARAKIESLKQGL